METDRGFSREMPEIAAIRVVQSDVDARIHGLRQEYRQISGQLETVDSSAQQNAILEQRRAVQQERRALGQVAGAIQQVHIALRDGEPVSAL